MLNPGRSAKETQAYYVSPGGADQDSWDQQRSWIHEDMKAALAASRPTETTFVSTVTDAEQATSTVPTISVPTASVPLDLPPVDQATREEWSEWGMPPPQEWCVRWGGTYGSQRP